MVLELDFVKMLKLELTPNDYVELSNAYLIKNKKRELNYIHSQDSVLKLQERGLLNAEELITDKGVTALVGSFESKFEEFWNLYPTTAIGRDGSKRVLRSKNSKIGTRITADFMINKRNFDRAILNDVDHDVAMRGLEVCLRTADKNYLPALSVFVNQRRWEGFYDGIKYSGKATMPKKVNISTRNGESL